MINEYCIVAVICVAIDVFIDTEAATMQYVYAELIALAAAFKVAGLSYRFGNISLLLMLV